MSQSRKKAAFMTLGCKVNQYETDAMMENLRKNGYEIVDFRERADVYIINTCTVTNIADRKSRQMIHRARRKNPEAVIVAAGCYVQTDEKKLTESHDADILVGNNRKEDLARILDRWFREAGQEILTDVEDMSTVSDYENLVVYDVSEHTRAYVKIQDGCNQFCSYCIIPYARGRIRSKKPEVVMEEVEALAEKGFQEIVLTGIHLSSYGRDLEHMELIDIIEQVSRVEGIRRIRLGSLEPRIITQEFLDRLVRCRKVCPHFHLSLQSGCDQTLKRMNRHYTTDQYARAVDRIRACYENPAVTTDVIAGFVGETEEEFAATLAFLKEIRLYEIHVFKYSVREGTRAQKMPGHLPDRVKSARVAALMDLAQEGKRAFEEAMIGTRCQVLLEEEKLIDGQTYYQGYTDNYVKILVKPENNRENVGQNMLVSAEITGFYDGKLLFGKI